MMELAVEADADVDLHLHDPDYLGIYTIKRLAALTKEAGWQGRVTVSHAYCLGEVPVSELREVTEMLAETQITIISSVPIDSQMPPVEVLVNQGIPFAIGSDNIYDAWSPIGNGDMLARASLLAERSRWLDEKSLASELGLITGGKTPLNQKGERQWPMPGDEASLVLVDAACYAQAIARKARRVTVLYQGKQIGDSLDHL
jgi:cytosine/adenosine deaminase-related metal-dependent hydrolase